MLVATSLNIEFLVVLLFLLDRGQSRFELGEVDGSKNSHLSPCFNIVFHQAIDNNLSRFDTND